MNRAHSGTHIRPYDRPVVAVVVQGGALENGRHNTQQADQSEEQTRQAIKSEGTKISRDMLVFCEKQAAVLESIKFRGSLMFAFERETGSSWFDPPEHENRESWLLPTTQHIRAEAQALLREFEEQRLPDLTALLQSAEK
ncbi:hypothetical protein G647_06818 [Cladophialophora carrionii CBS 160.54]|uniref:Uncharacterized protein n=1 Tax=Cladophialophora carrionii CBS 160.54 TaxID=1279043 RepID=V9D9U9_9EURO|nr:uncharacterized protein G647_06818 [Cladophialophora carrionii CBS 160.54]ETI22742.1 hypothetical protein G647_06818 [Cladophialophora carrionii CBS 160.54]